MNCREINDLLMPYIYGELHPDRAAAVRAHLDGCPDCSTRFAQLAGVRRWLSEMDEPQPTQMTVNRIIARARDAAQGPETGWRFGWLKVVMPICFMIVVGSWIAYHHWTARMEKKEVLTGTVEESEPDSKRYQDALPSDTEPEGAASKPPQERPALEPAPAPLMSTARESRTRQEGEASIHLREESPAAGESADRTSSFSEKRELHDETARGRLEGLAQAEKALAAGEHLRARHLFQRILRDLAGDHPARDRVLFGLARSMEGLGQVKEARDIYRKLVEESSALSDAARNRLDEINAAEGR